MFFYIIWGVLIVDFRLHEHEEMLLQVWFEKGKVAVSSTCAHTGMYVHTHTYTHTHCNQSNCVKVGI